MPRESKFVQALREHRLFNTHDLLVKFGVRGETDVGLLYCPPDPRRCSPAMTEVYFAGTQATKRFYGKRDVSMPEAEKWVFVFCPQVKQLVNSPFGALSERIPVSVLQAAELFIASAK